MVAERLAAGLDAATRLVLLDVLSAAAAEITRDLAPGSVDLRLRGREIELVVTQPSTEADSDERAPTSVELDDTSTSRTTLQPKQRRSAQRSLRTGDNFTGWAR